MKNIKFFSILALLLLVATPMFAADFSMGGALSKFIGEMGFNSFFADGSWKILVVVISFCVLSYFINVLIKKKLIKIPLLLVLAAAVCYAVNNMEVFQNCAEGWKNAVMILIGCLLLYLAIKKEYEPLLLLPIAFGMILTNLPGAGMFDSEMWNNEFLNADSPNYHSYGYIMAHGGLLDILYIGVKAGVYPCLIFLGVGAMTDFGPLIANPKSLLLGAAAQIGIFATFLIVQWDGYVNFFDLFSFTIPIFSFTPEQAASIGIIGGADGPTAIFLTSKLAPELLGPIAVAAYSYMALVPVIQPPIMRALTTKNERMIRMEQLRTVSKKEKILFPIIVAIIVSLIVPSAGTLIGCLMLGNLMKESGVVERLSKAAQNELNNIVVICLGLTVGATATATSFMNWQTLGILGVGIVAFSIGSASGVIMAKIMNLFLKKKINPLIGSAGVSAVPMAARVSQTVGQESDPRNFLLMHAMGPNVAGVIGSAVAAGILLSFLG